MDIFALIAIYKWSFFLLQIVKLLTLKASLDFEYKLVWFPLILIKHFCEIPNSINFP